MKNPVNYFEKNGFVYGVSYKYEYGRWSHIIYKFTDFEKFSIWLGTESYDFRTRMAISKSEARKLGYQE